MEKPARKPLNPAEVRRIIIGIMLAMFLGALDQTIVATALATIGRDLGDVADLSWVITAYLLSSTAVTPLYGKLSDVHGRRVVLLIAISIFVAGSIACALAPSMLILIVMRAVQGLGGGGLISLAQTIIADVVSPKERARFQGYIASVFGLASIGGPVLGGVTAEHLHWSLVFWINLPLGVLAYAMTDRALRGLPRVDRHHRLDLIGAGLMAGAAVVLMLALTWGGVVYPWGSVTIVGLLAGSALLWAAFGWRITVAEQPFLPLSVLFNPVVRFGIMGALLTMGTLIGLCMVVPIYLEAVLGHSASTAGLMLISLMGAVPLGATTAGRGMARIEHYKILPLAGCGGAGLLMALLALYPAGFGDAGTALLLAVAGFCIGLVLPVTTVAIQNAVPMAQMGTATGAMNFFRALGSAVIVAVFSAIFFAGIGATAGDALDLHALAGQMAAQGRDLAAVFSNVYWAAAGCLGASLVFLGLMEERPLRSSIEPQAAE
ncbi:MDR family MFS transporter [Zavarzinia sp.]|uniref:MDR family MFS transporter n=1 Tax=Zavarzinia sp. TaxID=2027920 RepID=UPI00356AFD42